MKVPITNLHPGDVQMALNLTDGQTEQITLNQLEDIADSMHDDYIDKLFWVSLKKYAPQFLTHVYGTEE